MKFWLSFLFLISTCLCNADVSDCIAKQESNLKIIKILELLNNISPERLNQVTIDLSAEKKIIDEVDDPVQLARLIVICYYLSFGQASTAKLDHIYELCGISEMKRLKNHPNFIEGLLFIKNGIRLDAGFSLEFGDVIMDSKDNPNIQKYFPEIIKRMELSR